MSIVENTYFHVFLCVSCTALVERCMDMDGETGMNTVTAQSYVCAVTVRRVFKRVNLSVTCWSMLIP